MSNFDDDDFFDDGLELDIDLSTSGEMSKGFTLKPATTIGFIEDDIINSDEISLAVTGSGLLSLEDSTFEEELLLDVGDIDLGFDGDPLVGDKPKYELVLSPAQNAVALYQPQADESFLVETVSKEIHLAINDTGKYERDANVRINEYLNSPKMRVLTKTAKFKSPQFRKQQDFRSLLVSEFLNHRAIPEEYTGQHIIDKVFQAYEAESLPIMSDSEVQELTTALKNFIIFANATFDEAERQTQLTEYKMQEKTLECPQIVGNFNYVCRCGTEHPMPGNRPTLTFLIREMSKSPIVTLMNQPVPCETCRVHLALPTPLVTVIEIAMQDYVKRIKATYEKPRIYRPKLDELMNMIPSDVKDLFQLEANNVVENKTVFNTANSAFNNYRKLIGMWMNNVTSQHNLEQVTTSIEDSPELLQVATQLTLVDFGFVADLYSYQMTKTIIHYLEGFSNFALTEEKLAYYKFCSIEGYDKKAFSKEYTNKWIYDNAAYIASLNNIYSGDTEMSELYVLPEHMDAINYVIGLHLLAKPELLDKTSDLAKWIKNPTATLKTVEKYYKKIQPADKDKLAISHRDLTNKGTVYPPLCWSDTYAFMKNIVGPIRYTGEVKPEFRTLSAKATRKTASEFYGVELPDKLIIKPSLMFEEFSEAFKDLGYLLFSGAIVDQVRKNLAIGIELYRKAGALNNLFKSHNQPVTDISNIMLAREEVAVDKNRLLFELVIKLADLPGNMNEQRDLIGYKDIVINFEEFKDNFTSDKEFMDKYEEVLECYL